ncbi:hypothetical protein FDF91_15775 [Clostridium botulinum]|nr:hypothetical protein [Clostridium botulinum]
MEYISAEEFLKQPVEVQKVFIDWWKASIGDLFSNYLSQKENESIILIDNIGIKNVVEINKEEIIPLLTEGQLRKFIEDKYDCKVMIEYTICENIVIELGKINKVTGGFGFDRKFTCHKNKFDLLKAYWVVACEIAKED